MSDHMLVIYEGSSVIGHDPDVAAEVVRSVVTEAAKQGKAERFYVASVTLARTAIALKLRETSSCQLTPAKLREARVIFGAVVREAIARASRH